MGDSPTDQPAAPPAISRAAFLGTAAAAMLAAVGVRWWLTPAEPVAPVGGPTPPVAPSSSSSGPPLVTAEPLPPVAPPPRAVTEQPRVTTPVQPVPESDRAEGRAHHRRSGRGTRTRRPRDKAATKPKPPAKPPAVEAKPAPDPALAPPIRRKLGPEVPAEPRPAPKEME